MTANSHTEQPSNPETPLDLLKRVLAVAELVAKAQPPDPDSVAKTQPPKTIVW